MLTLSYSVFKVVVTQKLHFNPCLVSVRFKFAQSNLQNLLAYSFLYAAALSSLMINKNVSLKYVKPVLFKYLYHKEHIS